MQLKSSIYGYWCFADQPQQIPFNKIQNVPNETICRGNEYLKTALSSLKKVAKPTSRNFKLRANEEVQSKSIEADNQQQEGFGFNNKEMLPCLK